MHLRVDPVFRRMGVGSALMSAVERWSRERHGRWLKVETQSITVPACRFYPPHGFALVAANPAAYAEFPHEIQLIWSKQLSTADHTV